MQQSYSYHDRDGRHILVVSFKIRKSIIDRADDALSYHYHVLSIRTLVSQISVVVIGADDVCVGLIPERLEN